MSDKLGLTVQARRGQGVGGRVRGDAKPALIISECQRGVVDPSLSVLPGLAEQFVDRGVAGRIATLAAAFRQASLPVVHCLVEHRPDLAGILPNSMLGSMVLKRRHMIEGGRDVEVPEEIAPQPGDFVSRRFTGLTAFYGTDLDAILSTHRIDTIVLAGVSTNIALPGLALEAVNRGLFVILPEDATAGATAQTHRFMVDNLLSLLTRVTSTDEAVKELAARG